MYVDWITIGLHASTVLMSSFRVTGFASRITQLESASASGIRWTNPSPCQKCTFTSEMQMHTTNTNVHARTTKCTCTHQIQMHIHRSNINAHSLMHTPNAHSHQKSKCTQQIQTYMHALLNVNAHSKYKCTFTNQQ